MKILRLLCLLVFVVAGVVTSRACDLCGCYTPQLNAMPGMESTHFFPWLAGWYALVAFALMAACARAFGRLAPRQEAVVR